MKNETKMNKRKSVRRYSSCLIGLDNSLDWSTMITGLIGTILIIVIILILIGRIPIGTGNSIGTNQ